MKFKNRMKRAATGLLALAMAVTTLLGSTGLTAYAADTEPNPQPPANGEKIFSVDPFDSDHSAGSSRWGRTERAFMSEFIRSR